MSSTEASLPPSPAIEREDPNLPPGRRILLAGATGRLGRAFAVLAIGRGWTVSGAVAGASSRQLGRPLAEIGVRGCETLVRPPSDLSALLEEADVYVSAAPVEAERTNLRCVASSGRPAVVATTGFTADDRPWLDDVAGRIPLVMDANFSIGMHWLASAIASLGSLPQDFDVSVLEAHRSGKRDRPSGTALALAARAHRARAGVAGVVPERSPVAAVEVASLRSAELPGIHQVWIGGPHELLRVEHLVLDRSAFAAGMVRAVEWVCDAGRRPAPGRDTLSDVLAADRRMA